MKIFINKFDGFKANEYIQKLEAASKACGVNGIKELVALESNGDKSKLGSILFCINKEIGLQDGSGTVNRDKVAVHIRTMLKHKDETFQNDVIKDCDQPAGADGAEKAFNFMLCLHQKLKN